MEGSKVTGIVKSLSTLEDDLDSLTNKVADMKKTLNLKAQTEVEKSLEKIRQIAIADAETIINQAKEKANEESVKIAQAGQKRLDEIQSQVDANFENAVKHTMSTVLKV